MYPFTYCLHAKTEHTMHALVRATTLYTIRGPCRVAITFGTSLNEEVRWNSRLDPCIAKLHCFWSSQVREKDCIDVCLILRNGHSIQNYNIIISIS